jgi:hypothetical protein
MTVGVAHRARGYTRNACAMRTLLSTVEAWAAFSSRLNRYGYSTAILAFFTTSAQRVMSRAIRS